MYIGLNKATGTCNCTIVACGLWYTLVASGRQTCPRYLASNKHRMMETVADPPRNAGWSRSSGEIGANVTFQLSQHGDGGRASIEAVFN